MREEAKQRAAAKDYTDKQGAALGNLRAFGDLLGSIGRLQARDAGQIGQIGGFKRGSSNATSLELDAASHKGDGLKLFGDVLGGLGTLGMSAGLSGKTLSGLFGGATAANSITPAMKTASAAAAASNMPLRIGSIY